MLSHRFARQIPPHGGDDHYVDNSCAPSDGEGRSSARAVVVMAALAAAIAIAGCGAAPGSTAASDGTGPPVAHLTRTWRSLRLPSGAVLPVPPGWRAIAGDPGSASAAVFGPNDLIRAYLNATPARAGETLADWTRFRIGHNAEEERDVRLLESRTNVVRRGGRESCVVDSYTTTRTQYQELACIVTARPRHAATVLVAAAQLRLWHNELPTFTRALDRLTP